MNISKTGIQLLKDFEGLRLNAYKCSAGVPTIGYGSTFYPDKSNVKMGDVLRDKEEAEVLLINTLKDYDIYVSKYTKSVKLTQHQFDALVCFAFNVGLGNLSKSTLLKKVLVNPNDETIPSEFAKWNRGGGVVLKGLTKRRQKEAELYFKKVV
jgi:lysozyme